MKKKGVPVGPSVEQLANLAAAISRDGKSAPEYLAKRAMTIWKAAQDLLLTQPPLQPEGPPLPKPRRYPVKLDEFLRIMLPRLSGRTGEKFSVFREYVCYCLANPAYDKGPWYHNHLDPYLYDGSSPKPFIEDYPLTNPRTSRYPTQNPPDEDNVVKLFAFWRGNTIPDPQSFRYHLQRFGEWYKSYEVQRAADLTLKRRVAGAKGRASQRRNRHRQ